MFAVSEHRYFLFANIRTLKKENVGGNGAVDMSTILDYIIRKEPNGR